MAKSGKSAKDSDRPASSSPESKDIGTRNASSGTDMHAQWSPETRKTKILFPLKAPARKTPVTLADWISELPVKAILPAREITEADVLIATWAWVLDIFLEINIPSWLPLRTVPKDGKSDFYRAGKLTTSSISKMIEEEMKTVVVVDPDSDSDSEVKAISDRTIVKHVEFALEVIKRQWKPKSEPLTDGTKKAMYRSLYSLVRLTIRSWPKNRGAINVNIDDHRAVAKALAKEFGRPQELSESQAIACFTKYWE